jgi:hypothetical protein
MANNAIPFGLADGIRIVEPFFSNDQAVVTDKNLGLNKWAFDTIGNASTIAYLDGALTVAPGGGLHLTTAATADGDGTSLHLGEDMFVLGGNGGWFRFKAQLTDQIASNNFRVGLTDSITSTAPTVGIWVECDGGVLSLEADSADHGDFAQAVTGVSTLTSGTTMVLATYHDFYVVWSGTNAQGGPDEVRLYVDGELGASLTAVAIDDDEEVEATITHWQDSGGALAVEMKILYYEAMLFR